MRNQFFLKLLCGLTLFLGFQQASLTQVPEVTFLNTSEARTSLVLPQADAIFLNVQDTEIHYGKQFNAKLAKDSKLNNQEQSIAKEAFQILNSPQFQNIVEGHKKNETALIEINDRTISYDDAPFSGMTWFEKNGFNIGKEAFKSEEELIKTVLHELHRLTTSKLRGSGNAADVSKETQAAFNFAEKAYYLFE